MISRGHRRELNRALHELRRPLQALALIEDAGSVSGAPARGPARRGLLQLARSALADLDRGVNGRRPEPGGIRPVSCRELIHACLERWRVAATDSGGIRLFWDAGPAPVECDPVRMAQAFDNLLSNALEHGGPPLVITGASVAERLRITIANGGPAPAADAASNAGRDPKRGHGLSVVAEVVEAHRGRFALCRTQSGCVAALELPLAQSGLAYAA